MTLQEVTSLSLTHLPLLSSPALNAPTSLSQFESNALKLFVNISVVPGNQQFSSTTCEGRVTVCSFESRTWLVGACADVDARIRKRDVSIHLLDARVVPVSKWSVVHRDDDVTRENEVSDPRQVVAQDNSSVNSHNYEYLVHVQSHQ